ncbi:protein translocase subunit SecF [Sphingosinicella rhizophila]|uniref:Protein-export membrane protein SecF n=1 Tax=Sphingosinicella rhizophila TaxID=3050082 RepID=A0ABU3QCC9_9SPHN|nr:protein translocase subunit SecF [Sphingosinicella sp. GR2756]MDT9601028.1 protein translocase subunit SecF [Sphingosinicella sp. GR2756]
MRLLKLVPDNTNVDFLRWRNIAIAISLLLMVASIALIAVKGLNFGVDFAGGQVIRVHFQQPPSLDELREQVGGLGVGDPSIQEFGSPQEVSIRLPLPAGGEEGANEVASKVRSSLQERYPGVRIDSVDTVSGKVSEELAWDGGRALLFAMIGITIYIWVRFEWQFGVGALFSLLHDVTLTLGFFALTQMEFDLNVIAALLTLIGYSLNDTIVIYDRVRENLRKYRKMDITSLLNLSMNETLSRTIATNLSMLLALGSLMLLGPDVIQSFTTALLISVVVGTYSTIYIAAPWLIWLKVNSDSFVPKSSSASAERVKDYNEGYER